MQFWKLLANNLWVSRDAVSFQCDRVIQLARVALTSAVYQTGDRKRWIEHDARSLAVHSSHASEHWSHIIPVHPLRLPCLLTLFTIPRPTKAGGRGCYGASWLLRLRRRYKQKHRMFEGRGKGAGEGRGICHFFLGSLIIIIIIRIIIIKPNWLRCEGHWRNVVLALLMVRRQNAGPKPFSLTLFLLFPVS